MAELTLQQPSEAGIELTYVAADVDGDSIPAGDGEILVHVKNGNDADITVTIASPKVCNQGFTHDQPIEITAGEDRFFGPFARRFISSGNTISWTYDEVEDVTVAAMGIAN